MSSLQATFQEIRKRDEDLSVNQNLPCWSVPTFVASRNFTLIYLSCILIPLNATSLPPCQRKVFKQSTQLGGILILCLVASKNSEGAKESLCLLFVLEGRVKGR